MPFGVHTLVQNTHDFYSVLCNFEVEHMRLSSAPAIARTDVVTLPGEPRIGPNFHNFLIDQP